MCGILAVLGLDGPPDQALRDEVLRRQRRLRHRGPDWSGIKAHPRGFLAHERLAIVDPQSGEQPLLDGEDRLALAANGEIYNHQELRREFADYDFQSGSDCEVILPLYQRHGADCVAQLDGAFAFVLSDAKTGRFIAARDHMGIVPLYYGRDEQGALWFASEMKALTGVVSEPLVLPPGHLYDSDVGDLVCWYQPGWHTDQVPQRPFDAQRLAQTFEAAVVKRLMSDVPWGVLLSGGLDSSLVASLAARHAARRVEDQETSAAWWPRVHSFCIGLEGSPDLAAARQVAEHLGTVHHEFTFTVQQGLDALADVIHHLETYDVTTIRASTPMYLMARKIKALGVKMVLSGEGADEIFGGYLYFHKAPDAAEFHHETVRKLKTLHLYDCLRANKSTAAWGVEVRVPFLDRDFLEEAMTFEPQAKMSSSHPDGPRIEKHVLRAAFDDPERPYLPKKVLWRQKEQFSDGVGYLWIDSLKATADARISDDQMAAASTRFPVNPPQTKEAYMYRQYFEAHFPGAAAANTVPGGKSIACSTPTAIAWDAAFAASADPSGRAVAIHNKAYA